MREHRPSVVPWLELAPLVFVAGFMVLRFAIPGSVPRLLKEDGALEYLQVLLYVVAGFFALLAAARTRTSSVGWIMAGFGVACLFVAVEEVSWGERLLGFETPESIRSLNTQGEANLHNLAPVQGFLQLAYIFAGLVGGVGWRAAEALPESRARRLMVAALPGRRTILFFLPVAVFYAWMGITGFPTTGWLRSQDQEVFETLFAGGCAIFAWSRTRAGRSS